jgi:LuxR family maltose regulon positive regulatory protein
MQVKQENSKSAPDIIEGQSNHLLLVRKRIEQLLTTAIESELVVVIAGAGYGKTRAVTSFLSKRSEDQAMVQLEEGDNLQSRFWEHFTHAIGRYNKRLGERLANLGFPGKSLMKKCYEIIDQELSLEEKYIMVIDDFHNITDPGVLEFFDAIIARQHNAVSFIIISRTEPTLNLMPKIMKGLVSFITEDELRFTKQETDSFFKGIGVDLSADSLAEVFADTEGWAFSVNLIGMSLMKAQNTQYARSAMKSNVFKLLDAEIFSVASPRLKRFLLQLSLINHPSASLVRTMAGDEKLVTELENASSFIRYDAYLDVYRIHHLLLDFLVERQDILKREEKQEAWRSAAAWCESNGLKIDAVAYYEKTGDYAKIDDLIYHEFPQQIPPSSAEFLLRVFENAPEGAFDGILIHYVLHMRILLSLGRIEDTIEMAHEIIKKYEALPVSQENCRILSSAYAALAISLWMRAPETDVYDFDASFEREYHYYELFPFEFTGAAARQTLSAFASMVGTTRAGAFEEYIAAMERSVPYVRTCLNGNMAGLDSLAQGELLFCKADLKSAEIHLKTAFNQAEIYDQYDIRNRALNYLLRTYVAQGKYESVTWVISQLELQLDAKSYHERQLTYDIIMSWYYTLVGSPELVASWLNDEIKESAFGEYVMGFANLIKAWLFYATGRYEVLLHYAQQDSRLKRFLLGRIEVKTLEALCQYQLKNRDAAFEALESVYELCKSNSIIMPIVEYGKSMRTLSTAAKKSKNCKIPDAWLDDVNHRSATYAKRLNSVIAEYRDANGLSGDVQLSALEKKILSDLISGLSRSEIAAQSNLSINTVKSVINMIYLKLGASSNAEAIRIAVNRKLI